MLPALVLPPAQLAAEVDEFYLLDQQVKAFAPTKKKYDKLAETIRARYEKHPVDQTAVAEGLKSSVLVSECAEERKLGLKAKLKIFSLIGKAAFVALVNVTLKAAAAATNEETVDKLATTERTGSRKLVAIAKISEAKAA